VLKVQHLCLQLSELDMCTFTHKRRLPAHAFGGHFGRKVAGDLRQRRQVYVSRPLLPYEQVSFDTYARWRETCAKNDTVSWGLIVRTGKNASWTWLSMDAERRRSSHVVAAVCSCQ